MAIKESKMKKRTGKLFITHTTNKELFSVIDKELL